MLSLPFSPPQEGENGINTEGGEIYLYLYLYLSIYLSIYLYIYIERERERILFEL